MLGFWLQPIFLVHCQLAINGNQFGLSIQRDSSMCGFKVLVCESKRSRSNILRILTSCHRRPRWIQNENNCRISHLYCQSMHKQSVIVKMCSGPTMSSSGAELYVRHKLISERYYSDGDRKCCRCQVIDHMTRGRVSEGKCGHFKMTGA